MPLAPLEWRAPRPYHILRCTPTTLAMIESSWRRRAHHLTISSVKMKPIMSLMDESQTFLKWITWQRLTFQTIWWLLQSSSDSPQFQHLALKMMNLPSRILLVHPSLAIPSAPITTHRTCFTEWMMSSLWPWPQARTMTAMETRGWRISWPKVTALQIPIWTSCLIVTIRAFPPMSTLATHWASSRLG